MYKKHWLIVLSLCNLFACSASGPVETVRSRSIPAGSDCITEGTIQSYEVLDAANLVVTATGKRRYHVELARSAAGLRGAWSVGFSSRTGRICAGFSELLVQDTFSPDRVRIQSVRRLTEEDYDDLRYRFGRDGTDRQRALEPEEVEGADVEELD